MSKVLWKKPGEVSPIAVNQGQERLQENPQEKTEYAGRCCLRLTPQDLAKESRLLGGKVRWWRGGDLRLSG